MPNNLEEELKELRDELGGQLVGFQEPQGKSTSALMDMPPHFPEESACAFTLLEDSSGGSIAINYCRDGECRKVEQPVEKRKDVGYVIPSDW